MANLTIRSDAAAFTAAVLVVAVAALVLRIPHLTESLWGDELASVGQAHRPFRQMLLATAADNYPPLHNIFLFASLRLFGSDEVSARLPSVLFGVLTIPVVYAIGREVNGRIAGVAAATLVAFIPFHVDYSEEARMYAIFAFFAALSLLAFLHYLRRPAWPTGTFYVLATAAMLYCHFFALFALVAQNLFYLYLLVRRGQKDRWHHLLRWVGIQFAVIALFLPWVPAMLDRSHAIQSSFWLPTPTVWNIAGYFRNIGGGTAMTMVGGLLILVYMASLCRRSPGAAPSGLQPRSADYVVCLLLWLLVPVALAYAVSLVLRPIFLGRYLIASSIAWYILVGAGIAVLWRINRLAATSSSLALFAVAAFVAVENARTPQRTDVRSAARFLAERIRSGDVVLANRPGYRELFTHYAPDFSATVLPYPLDDVTQPAGRRWIAATNVTNECFTGEPGPISARRKLVQRAEFFGVAVCLYDGPAVSR